MTVTKATWVEMKREWTVEGVKMIFVVYCQGKCREERDAGAAGSQVWPLLLLRIPGEHQKRARIEENEAQSRLRCCLEYR